MLTGVLCVLGAWRLWNARAYFGRGVQHAPRTSPSPASCCGFALWFFGFMVVGGEWFQMWQSQTWNGQEAAFRFIGCIGLVLIFLAQKDDELA